MSITARIKAAAVAVAAIATVLVAGAPAASAAPANCSPWVSAGSGVSVSACAPVVANGGIEATVLVSNSGAFRNVTVDLTLSYPAKGIWGFETPKKTERVTNPVPNTDGWAPSEFTVTFASAGNGVYSLSGTAYVGLWFGTADSPSASL